MNDLMGMHAGAVNVVLFPDPQQDVYHIPKHVFKVDSITIYSLHMQVMLTWYITLYMGSHERYESWICKNVSL